MPEPPFVAGIDLGGTNMQIGVVDAAGALVGRCKRKTQARRGADVVVERMVEGLGRALEEAAIRVEDLAAIGVGAPGAIDMAEGVVLDAPNLGWRSFPLVQRLKARLADRPILLDNDVNVAVVGEHRLGVGRNCTDMLGVWIGTGVGAGLILNGSLYHGALGTAGEIGQMILFPTAALGQRSVEHNCSRKHLIERMRRLVSDGHDSVLSELSKKSTPIGARLVATAYEAGDTLTVSVVDEVCTMLGTAVGSVVTLLAIPRVVLGGGLTEAMGQPFVDRVAQHIREVVFPAGLRSVEVEATQLEDDAGLLGAALMARERFTSG